MQIIVSVRFEHAFVQTCAEKRDCFAEHQPAVRVAGCIPVETFSQLSAIFLLNPVQPADIGWPTGNGKKLSNCQAHCLAQLCLAAA